MKSLILGYVLDGIPFNFSSSAESDEMPQDLKKLEQIITNRHPTLIPVLINLSISDENLIRRRAAQWVDPKSNICYPGQQVSYSRKRRHEGWITGAEDEVYAMESIKEDEEFNEPETNEREDEEVEEFTEEAKEKKKPGYKPVNLVNRQAWPILDEDVLSR